MKAKITKELATKSFAFIRKYKNTKYSYSLKMESPMNCLNIIDLCYWDDKIEGQEFIESFKIWFPLKIYRGQQ
jgi:hypothetical protein